MKKIFSLIFCAAALFALTSCEKFFTRSPWNEFDAETYFSNESQLRMYTDGFLNAWLPDYSESNGNDAYNDLIATKTSTDFFRADVSWDDAKQGSWSWGWLRRINFMIQLMPKNAKGKVIARLKIVCLTEGQFRRDIRGRWQTVTSALEYIPQGVTDLYVSCEGKGAAIDWIEFKNRENYFHSPSGQVSTPDKNGFIRRWLLLDPIDKPNRSNTVFTDSYLNENFAKEYFKGQSTVIPKAGQEEKVEKQSLVWHELESDRYNVKLFRFADINKKQTYGVLFCGVTLIECDEDIPNVRLAAGSNSASSWWLNGERVLLLSGDRRMVEDDGMSNRLTLRKGINVLRCSVINGPGMSDFCVRFLKEDGSPVTNYKVKTAE